MIEFFSFLTVTVLFCIIMWFGIQFDRRPRRPIEKTYRKSDDYVWSSSETTTETHYDGKSDDT